MYRARARLLVGLLSTGVGLSAGAGEGPGGGPPTGKHTSGIVHAESIGEWQGVPHYRTTLTSPVHHIDRIYRSMQGPITQTGFRLDPGRRPELLWLTGYEATIVDAGGTENLGGEFMCHSTVATDRPSYGRLLPSRLGPREGRMFTLAQGQRVVRFPEGFAIPFLSHQRLELQSQVLNHNLTDASFDVRQRIAIEFVRDRDLVRPPVPLTLTGVSGLKRVEGDHAGHFGLAPGEADPEVHGLGCSPGVSAGADHEMTDGHGQRFTGHWIVEPGREVNHTRVTDQFQLPYDTTIHYAAVHLHPYAESLRLVDLTTGKTVLEAKGRSADDRIALEEVGFVSSAEGIPLRADHEYELVSVYENTTLVDQDAMAGLYLYVRVHDVSVETIRARAGRAPRRGGTAAR